MDTQHNSLTFTKTPCDSERLNQWLFSTAQPYIKGRTMELGSDKGAISSLFVQKGLPLHLSDANEINRQQLRARFEGASAIKYIHDMNFMRQDFKIVYASSIGLFDTVVALNITEHGFFNLIELHNAKHLLRARGHIILVAPASTAFYNGFEENLFEWKKYNAYATKEMMGQDVEVLKVRYFNYISNQEDKMEASIGLSTLAILSKT